MILQKIPHLAEYDVLEHGKTVIIVGLTSYERLQVHKLLQDTKGLNTTSVGGRGDRKLIIVPTSDIGSGGMESAKVVNFKNNLA
jgi:predicted RNA-binding protein Jag